MLAPELTQNGKVAAEALLVAAPVVGADPTTLSPGAICEALFIAIEVVPILRNTPQSSEEADCRKTCKFRDETAHSIKTGQSRVAEVSRKRASVCDIFCEAPGRHPMKIGYARVSTEDQRLTLQLEALKQAGCSKVFREKVSGGVSRPARAKPNDRSAPKRRCRHRLEA